MPHALLLDDTAKRSNTCNKKSGQDAGRLTRHAAGTVAAGATCGGADALAEGRARRLLTRRMRAERITQKPRPAATVPQAVSRAH